jgi:hypothetical protein
MNFPLNPRIIFRSLFLFIIILLVANISVIYIYMNYYIENGIWSNNDYVKIVINLFDFNTEKNVPTFYSSLALLFSSILLFLIALKNKKKNLTYLSWVGLAIIFCYLSLDEILELHEHLVHLTRNFLNLSGMGTAYWTIPYLILIILLGAVYFKFLMTLPKKTLKFFLIAGAVFLTGAVGFELIGGRVEELYGIPTPKSFDSSHNVLFKILYTCEEFLEMLGIIIFIYALTSYKTFTIKIE